MGKFKISEIANLLGIPHTKAKRYTRELFPPDPEATLQSGRARSLTEEEAYMVFLAYYLVADHNFTVHEAKIIIEDLKDWFLEVGLFPMENGKLKKVNSKIKSWKVLIRKTDKPFYFNYEVEGVISQTRTDEVLGEGSMLKNIHIKKKEFINFVLPGLLTREEYSLEDIKSVGLDYSNVKVFRISYLCKIFNLKINGENISDHAKDWIEDLMP